MRARAAISSRATSWNTQSPAYVLQDSCGAGWGGQELPLPALGDIADLERIDPWVEVMVFASAADMARDEPTVAVPAACQTNGDGRQIKWSSNTLDQNP